MWSASVNVTDGQTDVVRRQYRFIAIQHGAVKMMMLNKLFMFHKFIINLIRTPAVKWNVLLIRIGSQRNYGIFVIVVEVSSHFICPEFTPWLPRRWCRVNFWRVTPSYPEFIRWLEVSQFLKRCFFLIPSVTRDSKTGHMNARWNTNVLQAECLPVSPTLQYGVPAVLDVTMAVRCAAYAVDFVNCCAPVAAFSKLS